MTVIRYRAGLPTLIGAEVVPQQKVRSTAEQKKATNQSSDPLPKLVSNAQVLALHNAKVAVARATQLAARQALAVAQAAVKTADAEETAAEADEFPAGEAPTISATLVQPSAIRMAPGVPPAATPSQPMGPLAPSAASHGPLTNRVPGVPQPIGRPNR
jgi:hypothetical protein